MTWLFPSSYTFWWNGVTITRWSVMTLSFHNTLDLLTAPPKPSEFLLVQMSLTELLAWEKETWYLGMVCSTDQQAAKMAPNSASGSCYYIIMDISFKNIKNERYVLIWSSNNRATDHKITGHSTHLLLLCPFPSKTFVQILCSALSLVNVVSIWPASMKLIVPDAEWTASLQPMIKT